MDAKTLELALLAALPLFCAGSAWISDHFPLDWLFLALGAAAVLGIAERRWGL